MEGRDCPPGFRVVMPLSAIPRGFGGRFCALSTFPSQRWALGCG